MKHHLPPNQDKYKWGGYKYEWGGYTYKSGGHKYEW